MELPKILLSVAQHSRAGQLYLLLVAEDVAARLVLGDDGERLLADEGAERVEHLRQSLDVDLEQTRAG